MQKELDCEVVLEGRDGLRKGVFVSLLAAAGLTVCDARVAFVFEAADLKCSRRHNRGTYTDHFHE
jgi:hypothetical protein